LHFPEERGNLAHRCEGYIGRRNALA
jgi:hypothetical protein